MSLLIIIRGPLGIGKSTVAKKVADKIQGLYISIDDVLAENNLDEIDEKIGCIPEINFLKTNQIIFSKLNQAIQKKVSVVIDGNFYHKNQIEDLIKNFPTDNYVFTLTAPLEICIQRDLQRPKSYGKNAAIAVYNLVSKLNYGQVIDTSCLSVDQTVDLIISKIGS